MTYFAVHYTMHMMNKNKKKYHSVSCPDEEEEPKKRTLFETVEVIMVISTVIAMTLFAITMIGFLTYQATKNMIVACIVSVVVLAIMVWAVIKEIK